MNYNWNWGIFFQTSPDGVHTYLETLLLGTGWTLATALAAWCLALGLGSFIGVIRTTPHPWLVRLGSAYVELFRNIPLLVQMFLWYFVLPELLPPAIGDENLLRHILNNLLTNAVKYSKEGEAVELTLERLNGDAIFRVQDRGIGIPVADQKQLFGPFHRAGNASHLPGTGLGLVIVKRCVELHGGEISCESTEGAGTTFTVRLPLFVAPA